MDILESYFSFYHFTAKYTCAIFLSIRMCIAIENEIGFHSLVMKLQSYSYSCKYCNLTMQRQACNFEKKKLVS